MNYLASHLAVERPANRQVGRGRRISAAQCLFNSCIHGNVNRTPPLSAEM